MLNGDSVCGAAPAKASWFLLMIQQWYQKAISLAFIVRFVLLWACQSVHPDLVIPQTKAKNVLISALRWCKLFVSVVFYFHNNLNFLFIAIFMAICIFFSSRNGAKSFFLAVVKLLCPTSKTNSSIHYDVMVVYQFALKCWGHQPYN